MDRTAGGANPFSDLKTEFYLVVPAPRARAAGRCESIRKEDDTSHRNALVFDLPSNLTKPGIRKT
jgi:hypothetical protein